MALAVDAFRLLENEILDVFSSLRDKFAILGSVYAFSKVLIATRGVYRIIKVHAVAQLLTRNYAKCYGPWAVVTGSTAGIGYAMAQELASCGVNIIVLSLGEGDCQRVAEELVVTGCTNGIGQSLSEELAKNGVNIILVARNDKKLQRVSKYIEQQFKVKTEAISVDFNLEPDVYNKIRSKLDGKEIGILVNNVGVMYDYPNFFLEVDEQKLWQLINVNITAATMMTHMILPQMVERRRGAVITVTSGTSDLPCPQMAVYSATKAYLDLFMRSLNWEYSPKGITIQTLRPMYVATRMTSFSSSLSTPSRMIPSAADYAKQALRTLGWSDRTTGYLPHSIQLWFLGLLPECVWMSLCSRVNMALRRQAMGRGWFNT